MEEDRSLSFIFMEKYFIKQKKPFHLLRLCPLVFINIIERKVFSFWNLQIEANLYVQYISPINLFFSPCFLFGDQLFSWLYFDLSEFLSCCHRNLIIVCVCVCMLIFSIRFFKAHVQ